MNVLIIGRGLIGKYINDHIQGSTIIESSKASTYLKQYDYDWVINCTFDPALNNKDYFFDTSYDAKILQLIKSKTKYLMLSSRCVYPTASQWNACEKDNICIKNISSSYGRNKFTNELQIKKFIDEKKTIVLRLPNIFGKHQSANKIKQTFFSQMHRSLLENGVIKFNFSKTTRRDFMYAGDLAKVIKLLIDEHVYGTYNCGYGYPVECIELANILIESLGYGTIDDTNEIKDEFFLNTSKINKAITYPKMKYLKEGILESINNGV
jgi:nucleoside-diphosphate-sugar epimerase